MARRVGGVAIVDTPEFMMALPLPPNAPEIKGFGRQLCRMWGWRAVDATPCRDSATGQLRILQYFARALILHTYARQNIDHLSVRYSALHPFTMPFTLRAGKLLYNSKYS
jgi:hypothetical protein